MSLRNNMWIFLYIHLIIRWLFLFSRRVRILWACCFLANSRKRYSGAGSELLSGFPWWKIGNAVIAQSSWSHGSRPMISGKVVNRVMQMDTDRFTAGGRERRFYSWGTWDWLSGVFVGFVAVVSTLLQEPCLTVVRVTGYFAAFKMGMGFIPARLLWFLKCWWRSVQNVRRRAIWPDLLPFTYDFGTGLYELKSSGYLYREATVPLFKSNVSWQ